MVSLRSLQWPLLRYEELKIVLRSVLRPFKALLLTFVVCGMGGLPWFNNLCSRECFCQLFLVTEYYFAIFVRAQCKCACHCCG